jgi:hypothetical protein
MFVKAHGPSHFDPRNCWGHPRDGCGATGCLAVAGDPSMQPVPAITALGLRRPERADSPKSGGGGRSSETNQESSDPHAGVETMGFGLRILWVSGGSWGISQLRLLDDQGHRGQVGGDGALRGTGPSFRGGEPVGGIYHASPRGWFNQRCWWWLRSNSQGYAAYCWAPDRKHARTSSALRSGGNTG